MFLKKALIKLDILTWDGRSNVPTLSQLTRDIGDLETKISLLANHLGVRFLLRDWLQWPPKMELHEKKEPSNAYEDLWEITSLDEETIHIKNKNTSCGRHYRRIS